MPERNGLNRPIGATLPARDLVSSVEMVYRNTRMAIMTGDYPPGASLRLQELASQNGVSMIPVREALRLLEAEGFVDIVPNRGARVAALSVEDFLDVHQTRIVLECEGLRQAIPHMTKQEIASARRLNARIVDQMERHGYASYEDHRAFHFTLYEPSRSRWLMRLIGIIWDHTERYRRQGARLVSPSRAGEEHERIVTAAERKDIEAAVQALQDHLGQTLDIVQASLLASPDVRDVAEPTSPA
jgi:DNA-binding GntR family transcriptional regulator